MTLTEDTIRKYAELTGDHNSLHAAQENAATISPFGGPVAHGFLLLADLLTNLADYRMPLRMRCRFLSPGRPGDRLTTVLQPTGEAHDGDHTFSVLNQDGVTIVTGVLYDTSQLR